MPVVNIKRDDLFRSLGKQFTDDEFDKLCFEFGIELDGITSHREMLLKEQLTKGKEALEEELRDVEDDVIYKIDIPANRYDLLCEEGLSRALRIFMNPVNLPVYNVKNPKDLLVMNVEPNTAEIRPFIVCAVLRNITFTEQSYKSFIDLQDKLHHNICRKRTLVAIGTHDLDTLNAPFSYEARAPHDIEFVPLSQTEVRDADNLVKLYEEDPRYKHLKPYVPIIKDSPVYPVIYDANRVVLSLPPLINGEHSKITLDTKNVLIECTATDHTKASVVLNTMVTMFSEHCDEPFTVEQVKIVYPDGRTEITPDLSLKEFECKLDYINTRIGINLDVATAANLLRRMQLDATVTDANTIAVKVPPTRSDILHPADIMEDVGIAYGYNNIVRTNPKTSTVGKEFPLNALSDKLRMEMAMAGFTEVLTLILCSHQEIFEFMKRKDDGQSAVIVANPKTYEFEACRNSLLPGLLKSVERNLTAGLPLRLFEVGDVMVVDKSKDVGSSNRRKLAAIYCGKNSGFEHIHGILDRVLEVVGMEFDQTTKSHKAYSVKPCNNETFFPGRQAEVYINGEKLGEFGILHPEVATNFGINKFPCSAVEIDVEVLEKYLNASS